MPVTLHCIHAKPTDHPDVFACELNLFGGLPHLPVCLQECGYRIIPDGYRPRQLSEPFGCIHRGVVVGEQSCASCGGSVRAKIHGCAVHGKCTLFSKPVEGVQSCRGCPDLVAPAQGSEEHDGRQSHEHGNDKLPVHI